MNVHGLQIRGPRFDSGRRLQLITLYLLLLPPLPAENHLKTSQHHTEKWQWHASTWWVVRGRKIFRFRLQPFMQPSLPRPEAGRMNTSTMNVLI